MLTRQLTILFFTTRISCRPAAVRPEGRHLAPPSCLASLASTAAQTLSSCLFWDALSDISFCLPHLLLTSALPALLNARTASLIGDVRVSYVLRPLWISAQCCLKPC